MMPSQLVAAATHARKAFAFDADDELAELDDGPGWHIPISACLQLALPRELVIDDELEVDVAKQVLHLAMMLSTAFSHIDGLDGQPVRDRSETTNAIRARFMRHPHEKLSSEYSPARRVRSSTRWIHAGARGKKQPRATRCVNNGRRAYCARVGISIR